jgi:hypothetical protein
MMVGRIRMPRVRAPDRIHEPNCRKTTKKPRPKRPNTTEGTPARQLMPTRIMRMKVPCLAYSVRYTAEITPRGRATEMAPRVRYRVPRMAGMIPPRVMESRGGWVRNSQEMACQPLYRMNRTIPPRIRPGSPTEDEGYEEEALLEVAPRELAFIGS